MSAPDRRAMVERPGKDLSVRRQCALLSLTRSGVYRSKPVTEADDLAVMRRIDELHLELPFYGSRRMTFELNKEGRGVNRKRVRRLMRVMGIEALVPRPGTSRAAPGHKIYPYLLRGLTEEVLANMRAAGLERVPLIVGGIIPPADAERLRAAEVAGVYTPKDFEINEVLGAIVAEVERRLDLDASVAQR